MDAREGNRRETRNRPVSLYFSLSLETWVSAAHPFSKPHSILHPATSKMVYRNNSCPPCQAWGRGGTRR